MNRVVAMMIAAENSMEMGMVMVCFATDEVWRDASRRWCDSGEHESGVC